MIISQVVIEIHEMRMVLAVDLIQQIFGWNVFRFIMVCGGGKVGGSVG